MCRSRHKRHDDDGSSSSRSHGVSVLVLVGLVLLTTALALVQGIESYVRRLRRRNRRRLRRLLAELERERAAAAAQGRADEAEQYAYLSRARHELTIAGFFHPFCNAGGGGERVLFHALAHHAQHDDGTLAVVYTGDLAHGVAKHDILARAHQRFGIRLSPARVHFIPLASRALVEDGTWKHFTLLGQSLGAAVLGAEAMAMLVPDIFLDTMGYAFAYPIVRFFAPRIPIAAYVHYPTISTDMLQRVKSRTAGHTNDASVASSAWKTHAKLLYYRLFASAYTFSLARANTIAANSSWTKAHLDTLLLGKPHKADAKPVPVTLGTGSITSASRTAAGRRRGEKDVEIVYPPCDTTSFSAFPLEGPSDGGRDPGLVVSLAQFRPEKEHATQIRLLRALFDIDEAYRTGSASTSADSGASSKPKVRLVMMGSCRNEGDEARIEGLKALARDLGVEDSVSFVVNAPFADILATLSRASVGLSTMVDEHFGINVVEFMAAGLITLSHASAGPYLDIAVPVLESSPPTTSDTPSPSLPTSQAEAQAQAQAEGQPQPQPQPQPTGFHAHTAPEFAQTLAHILALPPPAQLALRARARRRAVEAFGSATFEQRWRSEVWDVLLAARATIVREVGGGEGGKGEGGKDKDKDKEE